MRTARLLGGFGRLLIWLGAIVLAFVVYQLYGTGIEEAQAQNSLESEFQDLLEGAAPPTTESSPTSTPGPTTTTTIPFVAPAEGEAVAQIVIPKIGVDKTVVEGVSRDDLKKGPGHYPDTPLPGQPGNSSIAGHRTTYGEPFNRIDELEVGDEIMVTTIQGTFTYAVTAQEIVAPTDVDVIADKGDNRLTLTSCHPKFSARQRIIVTAELKDPPAKRPVRQEEAPVVERTQIDDHPSGPLAPVILLGLLALAIWILFYALGRKWRRWPSVALAAAPFTVALYFFFQAVTELLPANY